ncbi:MAG TPA: ZIP family metal transporter [Firmicutes bacterium]|jgi:ZIP family zinc transporter|nr:ZIP family metal transporter [Bacillota bacterium]
MNTVLLSSLLAGFGTTIGAAAVLFWGRTMKRELPFFLGCAGGIMLGIVFFDLIPSALQQGTILATAVGVLCGIVLLQILDAVLDVFFPRGGLAQENFLRMGYLIAIGIALHDLPEGFAIAAGYAVPGQLGLAIALAIGLHNLPEGMAVAVPLNMAGVSKWSIMGITVLVSLFTPLGTLIGLFLISFSQDFIALLLAMAGGAMFYLVVDELLPAGRGHSLSLTTGGFLGGLVVIYILHLLLP